MELLWIGIVLAGAAIVRATRNGSKDDSEGQGLRGEYQRPLAEGRIDGSFEELNPSTGLPMLLGLPVSDDISGTPFGGMPGDRGDLWPDSDSMSCHEGLWGGEASNHHRGHWVNPATGLPMTQDGPHGFDVQGNPYGVSNDDLMNAMYARGELGWLSESAGRAGVRLLVFVRVWR